MTGANDLSAALSRARQRFLEELRGISDDDAKRRPATTDWSIIEVLAHMIDVDDYYLGQAFLLRDQRGAEFHYFDDDTWKRQHPTPDEFTLKDILARLHASHDRVIQGIASLTEEELGRPGKHPRGIHYTVRDVLLRFPAHDENHRQQIAEIRAALSI